MAARRGREPCDVTMANRMRGRRGGLDARSQYAVLRQGEKWEKYVWNAATLKVKTAGNE